MKLRFIKRAIFVALLFSSVGIAQNEKNELCTAFLPNSSLRYPVGFAFNGRLSGLEREQYDSVLNKIEEIYGPIVTAMGGKFRVFRDWENPALTAKAARGRAEADITIYGGIARHPAMTEDGLALVACHEIGHHFGGYPKMTGRVLSWMSLEGQADYFATLKCMRLYFAHVGHGDWLVQNSNLIPESARFKCSQIYAPTALQPRSQDYVSCLRSTMAGVAVAGLFKEVNKDSVLASVETPDRRVAPQTLTGHPPSQCRLDTYFQGALCDREVSEPISNKDYRIGACSDPALLGARPACWFRAP